MHQFQPESLMMTYGYKPELSEGALKCPIFQTSTFVFKTAEEGKAFFEVAYGKRDQIPDEELGLIYSRINNPNLEIAESRLCLWDEADESAIFESGMSAITTVLLEFLQPGDLVLFSSPLYGGTDHFIRHFLVKMGIHILGFSPGQEKEEIINLVKSSGKANKLKLIYIETPANPTNDLIDIAGCKKIADYFNNSNNEILIAVDNTYMGPLWQQPLKHGADLVIYSATKYIGGHSDVIAGAVSGSKLLIKRVKTLRTFLGNMASPWTCWLLMRSLETLKIRMEQQQENAIQAAHFLHKHPKVIKVNYLGLIDHNSREYAIYKKQCTGSGAMISFYLAGGEKEAFKFLNTLKLIKLAVSLGSTESLAQHPKTMTHAGMDPAHLQEMGITDSFIRLSIGVENYQDIIKDLEQALNKVEKEVFTTFH